LAATEIVRNKRDAVCNESRAHFLLTFKKGVRFLLASFPTASGGGGSVPTPQFFKPAEPHSTRAVRLFTFIRSQLNVEHRF